MRAFYILGLLLLCITASANVVYKSVQKDGTVVYTDVPSKGATSVNLSAVNSAVISTTHSPANQAKVSKPNKQLEPHTEYSVFIRTPVAEQTLRNNAGEVIVNAEVLPKKAGKFQLILDNQIVHTQTSGKFGLENIQRGAHNIEVNFLDNSGKILASSKQQTFYLHKASALIRAN